MPTHTGTASTPLQFSGQYTDAETGLVYLRARYYDPATAQFLTIDPLVSVTGTPYAYVVGNPLNYTDPSGKDCGFWCWAGITVAVVAVSVATAGLADAAIAAGGAGAVSADAAAEGSLQLDVLDGAAADAEADGTAEDAAEEGSPGGAELGRPDGVPDSYVSEPARGDGTVWREPGSSGDPNTVRIMRPGSDSRYPNGYRVYKNSSNQPLDINGRPGPRSTTHIPVEADGSCAAPKGWPN